jgi:hypothetical protein
MPVKRKNPNEKRLIDQYRELYESLFTDEEKKRIVLLVIHNQPELVGAAYLKRRLINHLFKNKAS